MIGRHGNPELANRELEAAFVNNEGSLVFVTYEPRICEGYETTLISCLEREGSR